MPIPSTRSSTSKRTYAPRETASRQYGVHLNDDTARRKREGTERFTARREGEVAAVAPPPAPRQTVNPALAVEAKGAQIRPTTTQPVPAHPQLCILRTPLTSGTTTRVSAQHRLSDHTEYRIHNWRKLPSGRVVRGDGAGPVVALWALALGWMYMAYQRRGAVLRVVSGWMVRAGLMKVQCGPEVGEETVSVLGYDVGATGQSLLLVAALSTWLYLITSPVLYLVPLPNLGVQLNTTRGLSIPIPPFLHTLFPPHLGASSSSSSSISSSPPPPPAAPPTTPSPNLNPSHNPTSPNPPYEAPIPPLHLYDPTNGRFIIPLSTSHTFIPLHDISTVILNEGLPRWNVRYYLAIVRRDEKGVEVALNHLCQPIDVLLEVYHGVREIMFDEYDESDDS